jgi:hypothetical protein
MILYAETDHPDYILPPLLAPDQVVCGPHYSDRAEGGRTLTLATPRGAYDIAEVARRLAPGEHPELLVVREDSVGRNAPCNLGALGCPAVLVVGDTHHQPGAIQRLLRYAMSEPFEQIVLGYTRQHAHFFVEAGLPRVRWLPGFYVRRMAAEPIAVPEFEMSFVGSFGERHLRRRELCRRLLDAGLPLALLTERAAIARRIHRQSRISLNCSLNGDLNLRVFETLESGSLLLTDRLSPQAGLDRLLTEGEHFVAYDGIEDCLAKGRALLADRARAADIARAGHAAYEATLAPEILARDFLELARAGVVRDLFDLRHEPRTSLPPAPDQAPLMVRIAIYEILQALQRRRETTRLLAMPCVEPRLLCDLADLPRFRLAVHANGEPETLRPMQDLFARAGVADRIRLRPQGEAALAEPFDLLLTTSGDWTGGRSAEILARARPALLLLADLGPETAPPPGLQAAGFSPVAPRSPLFSRAGIDPFDYCGPPAKR